MCFKCGNMEHLDLKPLEKAISVKKAKIEARARYPLQAALEGDFKDSYRDMLKTLTTTIFKPVKK